MTKEQMESLEQTIFASFWRANEMNRSQAAEYAALAVAHMRNAIKQIEQ